MYNRYRLAFSGAEEVLPQGAHIDSPAAKQRVPFPRTDIKTAHEAGRPLILVDCRTPEEQAISTLPHAVTEAHFRSALPPRRSAGVLGFGAKPASTPDLLRAVQPFLVPPSAQLFNGDDAGGSAAVTALTEAHACPPIAAAAATSAATAAAASSSSQAAGDAATAAAASSSSQAAGDAATAADQRDKDTRPLVVLYCTIGARSGLACGGLAAAAPPLRVANLAGSLITWTHSGGKLVTGGETGTGTTKVHVYGKKWALQPAHLSAVW